MSKKTSKPQNRKKKTTHSGMKIRGRARVRVKGDAVGRDKNVQGDEINAGGDASVVKVGAGATVGDINFGGKRKPKPEELVAAKRAYLEFVIRNKSNFIRPWIIALPEDRSLKLDDVYVSLMVEREILESMASKTRNADQKPERINVAQAIREHTRVAIKGDPGAGKSTCTRFLDLLFASAMWQMTKEDSVATTQVQDKEGNKYGQARLPILVRIAEYAAEKGNSSLSLRDYLPMAFRDVDAPQEVLSQVFIAALREGNALVLLDGLDEIAKQTKRSKIVESIEKFVSAYPKNHFVVTSRVAGYVPIAGFESFTFSALEGEQLGLIFGRWYFSVRLVQMEDPATLSHRIENLLAHTELYPLVPEQLQSSFVPEAQQFAEEFGRQVDAISGAQRLIENPLTLTMLVELRLKGRPLAERRSDLYEEILANLLERWETDEREIAEKHLVPVWEAEEKLAPLAYWMHTSKTNQDPKGSEIEKELAKLCAGGRKDAADLWRRLREFTPLFVESSHGRFRFAHRTFQEYFVAKELLRDENKTADLIYRHRHQPNWEEPILLALSSVPDATDLIRTAILANSPEAAKKNFKSSDFDDVLHRDFFFAARCVGDGANIDNSLATEFAERLVQMWFDGNVWGFSGPSVEKLHWNSLSNWSDSIKLALANARGTQIAKIASPLFISKLYLYEHPILWGAYEGLEILDQDCTPHVIKFFFHLKQSDLAYASRISEDALEEMKKKKDAMLPALEEMLRGDQESKLYAAILLGEYGLTTPEALRALFQFVADFIDPFAPLADEENSRARQRKNDLRYRALGALVQIVKTIQVGQTTEVIVFLRTVIEDANAHIERILVEPHGEGSHDFFYDSSRKVVWHEKIKFISAYILFKFEQADATGILRQGILNPRIKEWVWSRVLKTNSLETLNADQRRNIDFFAIERAKDSILDAARFLGALHQVSEEIIAQAFAWSETENWELLSFAIELFEVLHVSSPAILARLFELLERDRYANWESEIYADHVREKAIDALNKLGELPVEYLPKLLELIRTARTEKTDQHIRWVCTKILADGKISMPESRHQEIFQCLLEHGNSEKAMEAIWDLAISPEVTPLVLDVLRLDNNRLGGMDLWLFNPGRSRRIKVPDSPLGEFDFKLELSSETTRLLLETLGDANPQVRHFVDGILFHALPDAPGLVEGLRALLQHPAPWVRYRAMDNLLRMDYKGDDVVETWLELIKSEDEELRAKAEEDVFRVPQMPEYVSALWSLLENTKSEMVKGECLDYLIEFSGATDQIINFLVKSLEDDTDSHLTPEERENPETLTPEIQERLALKRAAQHALYKFDELPTKIEAALLKQSFSPNPEQQRDAVQHLRSSSRLDANLVLRLRDLLDDSNGVVRGETCEAIAYLFRKYHVGFENERIAIAEKLYTMTKVKYVPPTLNPPVHFGSYPIPNSPVPPPGSEEIQTDSSRPPDGSEIILTSSTPPLTQVESPTDLQATTDEQTASGFFGVGAWGALWAVAGTLAPTTQNRPSFDPSPTIS